MSIIKYLLAIVFILTVVQGTTISPNESLDKDIDSSTNITSAEATSSRTGRIMTIFNKEPKLSAKRYGPPNERIRSRSDHFPPPSVQQRYPGAYQRHPVARPPSPQILRRVQNSIPNGQLQRLAPNQLPRYDLVKSSRYSAAKNGLQYPSGKGSPYRPHYGSDVTDTVAAIASSLHHPNALAHGNTGPNSQFSQHFKPSPNFSGNVIVRPIGEQQQHPQFVQHPLPQQQQFTFPEQHPFPKQQPLYQRDHFSQKPVNQPPIQQHPFPYQQPGMIKQSQQEPLLSAKSVPHHVRFENNPERPAIQQIYTKPTPSHSYSVYEEQDQPQFKPADSKDAQEYLKFMSSNGYFLPKVDPNYKKIDDERDSQQLRQQQKQQELLKQLHYQKSSYDSDSAASTYQHYKQQILQQQQQQKQQPIKVSQLFFHDNPAPPASSTVVRSSYQTGHNNNFVVSSDGQKVGKRVVSVAHSTLSTSIPIPSTAATTPSSASYHHFHYSSSRNRTPEPVRFEFTERDAITPATYTHSPQNAQQRNSIAVGNDGVGSGSNYIARSTVRIPTTTQRPSTTASHKYNDIKPVNEDDPEDGEDMHHVGSDFYGRAPVNPSQAATTPEPPSEQKDTEDYCERICSNVQDDDEEIVCGSDGFMYTSEAQMECYASCLQIDVTIQSKGSCNAS